MHRLVGCLVVEQAMLHMQSVETELDSQVAQLTSDGSSRCVACEEVGGPVCRCERIVQQINDLGWQQQVCNA